MTYKIKCIHIIYESRDEILRRPGGMGVPVIHSKLINC